MGWWSKTWKKVKNVFKKVTKVVKKVVKSVGKTAKKVWNKVKGVAKKFSKGMSKLGPFANIAMNFIPGFGQLWSAYGIWGQLAKGAITGFALSGGSAKGALIGAATMGAADIFKNMQGTNIAEKVGNWFEGWTNDSAIGKAIGQTATKFKDAFKPTGEAINKSFTDFKDAFKPVKQPWEINQAAYEMEAYGGPRKPDWKFGDVYKAPSLLDKIKDAAPKYPTPALSPMDSAQAAQLAWTTPDTSPLQSVGADTSAGGVSGQAGYGRDANEELIRSLGLKSLLDQYNTSRQTFMA